MVHSFPTRRSSDLILLPPWFPIHLSKMSYWARTVIAPLLVLQARKPLARNARGVAVAELYQDVMPRKPTSRAAGTKRSWSLFFKALDAVLKTGYRTNSANPKGIVNQALIKEKRFAQAGRGVYQLKK